MTTPRRIVVEPLPGSTENVVCFEWEREPHWIVQLLDAAGGEIHSELAHTEADAQERAADFREAIDQPASVISIPRTPCISLFIPEATREVA